MSHYITKSANYLSASAQSGQRLNCAILSSDILRSIHKKCWPDKNVLYLSRRLSRGNTVNRVHARSNGLSTSDVIFERYSVNCEIKIRLTVK